MNLPPPVSAENTPAADPNIVTTASEVFASSPEIARTSVPGLPTLALPIPTAPVPVIPVTDVSKATNSSTPSVADDSDLIEKEWVQKAKEIISKTQSNPYQQSKELSIFKADYMQKRYNKILKLSE